MVNAGSAVATHICYRPGYSMCTQFKSVDHIVITKVYNDTGTGSQAVAHYITAYVMRKWFRNTDIGIAIPEVSTYTSSQQGRSSSGPCVSLSLITCTASISSSVHQSSTGPGTDDLLTATAIFKWFVPVSKEKVTQTCIIGQVITTDLGPSRHIRIAA